MKVGIIGGTQGVGRQAVEQALAQGHSVTLLARTPAKVTITHANLNIVAGDVLDLATVEQVVAGQDVIINSLGSTPNNPDDVCTRGTQNIIRAMQRFGVRRLITVTALGVGDSYSQLPFFFKTIVKTVLRKAYADKETQEAAIRASDLDWIIVRPPGLTDGPLTGQYVVGPEAKAGQMSRADVAHFVLQQLADDTWLHHAVALG